MQKIVMPRIELPVFDGSKAGDWLENCKFYFNYYQTPEMYKVQMASMHFTGDATKWFSCYRVEHPDPPWPVLVNAIFERFKVRTQLNPVVQFRRVKQEGTVDDYIMEYQRAKTRLLVETGIKSEFFFVWSFISGLRDEIQNSISLFRPKTLDDAFNLALELEVAVNPGEKKMGFLKTSYSLPYKPMHTTPVKPIQLPVNNVRRTGESYHSYKPPIN